MSIAGMRQRYVIMMSADAADFAARLREHFPEMKFLLTPPYWIRPNGTCWAGTHPDFRLPYVDRFDHYDPPGTGVNEGYTGWIEPPGWIPRLEAMPRVGPPVPGNPFAGARIDIADWPRLRFRFIVTTALGMADLPSRSERPMVAHHDREDSEKRAFVDAVWRIWARGATTWWAADRGFVGLPEEPRGVRTGAKRISIFAGFHAVRHARAVGLATKL